MYYFREERKGTARGQFVRRYSEDEGEAKIGNRRPAEGEERADGRTGCGGGAESLLYRSKAVNSARDWVDRHVN